MTAKMNFKINQGSTFNPVLRWEGAEKVYKVITNITKAAPVVITAVEHGLVSGWRVKLTDIVGTKELNNATVYHPVTVLTPDTISINSINSISYTTYVQGGVIEYNKPIDLTGMTARMQLRTKLESDVVLHELTTENGGIILDNTTKQIKLLIPAATTTTFDFPSAVYNLEIIDSIGVVFNFARGTITLNKEVTR